MATTALNVTNRDWIPASPDTVDIVWQCDSGIVVVSGDSDPGPDDGIVLNGAGYMAWTFPAGTTVFYKLFRGRAAHIRRMTV